MTPDELLRLHPRETLRWLRGRLGLSQVVFALRLRISPSMLWQWEARRRALPDHHRERLVPLLALQLATPEGQTFVRALGKR